ncbi:MAG: radical SAM protein [Desulfobulbaceae bacterium]|nr:radical SAM protein [Desulfobulbaceae bacterium]
MSLGVDLVPAKICNFNCIYCEVGVTTGLTVKRREYTPTAEIIAELKEFFAGLDSESAGWPDFVTLTSSGEPTLHTGIGDVIRYVKQELEIPVAVLTNGALLFDPQVRLDLLAADIVVPSLDAARPGGEIWLEILLVADVNDNEEDIDALVAAVARIRPDRVQLNTVVRPPAESWARPLSEERIKEVAGRFKDCKVEIIADYSGRAAVRPERPQKQEILEMLKRRPCTRTDIREATGLAGEDVDRLLNELAEASLIRETMHDGRKYYQAGKPR